MIEHTSKHSAAPESSSDRAFGFVFTVFFVVVAVLPLFSGHELRTWALGVAGGFLGFSLLVPKVLAPANRLWTKFGALLHNIVSPIALGVLFYLVVTPIGLLMRLMGKDPLRLKLDASADSYWVKRDPPGPAGETLNNQF